ncbi:MAG: hypothetical protein ACYCSN_08530 [Acidobacteriaceae bacterium]
MAKAEQQAVEANHRRVAGDYGKHVQETGRLHRTQLCPLLRDGRNAALDLTQA